MATTKTTPTTAVPEFDVDASVERIRVLNEKVIEAAKQSGNLSLDAYEKTLASLVDLEHKVAGASQLEWVTALAGAHTSFVSEVSNAYVKAARQVLS